MADADARIIALLEELVALQKIAGERQERMLQRSDDYYAAARARTEQAIELQKVAVARQRTFIRAWAALIVFVLACVIGLLVAVSRYLH
jgi:hypothetical protein